MRRFLPLLLAVAVLAVSCGDDGAPTEAGDSESSTTASTEPPATSSVPPATASSEPPPPSSSVTGEPTESLGPDTEFPGEEFPTGPVPKLLLANGTAVELVESTEARDVKITPLFETVGVVGEIRQSSDGSIFTHEALDPSAPFDFEVARYDLEGNRAVIPDATWLYDVGDVNGVESVIVAGPSRDDEFSSKRLLAIPLSDGAPVDIGAATDVEFGVGNVDVFDGVAVVSAGADLTEVVSYVEVGGTAPGWSPTDDLPYGEPPFVTAAAFSADGADLYWAEGPDWGYIEEEATTGPIPQAWEVLGADVATGDITFAWRVSDVVEDSATLMINSIIDVETHLILNRTTFTGEGPIPLQPLVVDFTVEEPELWALEPAGLVTLAVVVP